MFGRYERRAGLVAAIAISVLAVRAEPAIGQADSLWIGNWTLNLQESNHDREVFKRLVGIDPADILSQTLKIEHIEGKVKMTGDVVISGRSPVHAEESLNLDGSEVTLPDGGTGSFKRLKVSPDGKRLTRNHTQTLREVVPAGTDPTEGKITKRAIHILIYDRSPQTKSAEH